MLCFEGNFASPQQNRAFLWACLFRARRCERRVNQCALRVCWPVLIPCASYLGSRIVVVVAVKEARLQFLAWPGKLSLPIQPNHSFSRRPARHTTLPSHNNALLILDGSLTMNKLANMRHWSERMGPGFGMSRPNMNMTAITPQHKPAHGSSPILSPTSAETPIHYSFNVPFASDLAGPNVEDILYATTGAAERWTHPESAPDDVPIYELPVHAQNVMNLRDLCKELSGGPLPIEAYVKSSEPKRVKGQVTNVCLSGSPELVHKSRETILNDTPLALVRGRIIVA